MLKIKAANESRSQLYSKIKISHIHVDSLEECDVIDLDFFRKNDVLKAASLGKSIICQNPVISSEVNIQEILSAYQDAGVRLWISNPLTFSAEYKKVKDLVGQGAVGKVGTVRIIKNISKQEDANQTLLNEIDWLQSIFGNVKRVYAKGLIKGCVHADVTYVSLRFENKVIAHININCIDASRSERLFLELAGEKGVISYDSTNVMPVHTTYYSSEDHYPMTSKKVSYVNDPAVEEINAILQSIQSSREAPSLQDYLPILECGLAVIESMKENKVITLSDRGIRI